MPKSQSNFDLSIIVVSYNTQELTIQTLQSVYDDARKSNLLSSIAVLVIDNNSKDDSVAKIKAFKQQHSKLQLTVLPQTKNLGFGRANNLGLDQAKSDLVMFLNSDTIVQPGCLANVIQAFEEHPLGQPTADLASHRQTLDRLGVLAARLENQDGSYQAQGGSLPTLLSLFSHMFFLDDLPLIGQFFPSTQKTGLNAPQPKTSTTNLVQQDWVGATAMVVRTETLAEIGRFDPNIFMYGEDVELCIRAKNHHWDVAIHPQAVVTHLGSASSSSKNAIIGELTGYVYIWSKHKPDWQIPVAKAILRAGASLRRWIFGTIRQDKTRAEMYESALKELK